MGTCNHKMMWFVLFAVVLYQVSSSCWETENGRKDKYCKKDSTDTDREVRMLLIGKTRVGKSTTGNTILGFRAFDTKISATSVTSNTQYNETERFGKRLVVIDTPGLFDTDRSNEEVLVEMSKWYALASPGLHAIILVVQVGRFTEEEQKTVDFFMKAFGEELKNFLIIVFTHKDRLEDEDMTIDDFVRTLDDKSNLKSLIDETKGRYTAIGYKGQQSEREKEVRHILSMIDELRETNDGLFSNGIFKRVENIMKETERKKMEEAKDKGKTYTAEEVVILLNAARSNSRVQIINNNQHEDFFSNIDRKLRILLIGKKGVGKSTTGNTLLGFPAFDTKVSATSVTFNTQYNENERFGKRLVVIDTPGLFDTDRPNEEVLVEMSKWYALASPGLHAIILVVQIGGFTEEEEKAVNIYMKVFGEEFKKYLIIVFSHKDRLDASDLTIDDFVRTLDDKSNLKSLIYETEGRYTAIGYRGRQSEREKEVRHILSMIEKMKETNGGLYYSKDIFKSVEQIMKENEIKKMKETNDKGRMYTEEVAMLLNAARANSKVPINNNQENGLLTKFPYTVAKWILALVSGARNENNDEEEDAKKI